jgi:4-carboxymuconolactone decarboxylase
MPRIPYADLDTLPEDARQYLGARRSHQGNVFKMIANAGKAATGYLGLGAQLRQNLAIELMLYEYVIVRVANLSRAAYVIRQHEAFLRKNSVSEDIILALRVRPDSPVFTEAERAALLLVDEIVLNVRASEATVAGAAKHFNPEQLMHIMLTTGQYMMTSRIVENFDVDLQPLSSEN